jgi:twitching motility protein PilJ
MSFNIKDLPAKIKQTLTGKAAPAVSPSAGVSGSSSFRQVIIPVVGLIIFIALAFYAISQVRVNGPVYVQLKANDDLRADILPPPMYSVDAYAAINEAYVAASANDIVLRDKKLAEVKQDELDFNNRIAYWQNLDQDASMQDAFQLVVNTNKNFYSIYNKDFLPAIQLGAISAAKPLNDLAAAFDKNKLAVRVLVEGLNKKTAETEASSTRLLATILTLLALLGLVIVAFIWIFGARQAKTIDSAVMMLENDGQANQMAVLNLLDEMGDLADGDLTVRAEVRENITGAIADSINYTIDSLRDLVTGINRASEQVNTATGQAQATSVGLLSAAEKQAVQITETTEAVSNMTRSILQVSSNASQASQVAQRSLQAATQGSLAVQNTIAGMNGIREQIQETSKRIKRLGESSQEIGEIVELISDITEQTNILALNAAIQAASAGEAGRGFTVVAEEVQRLAERSSEATKQIGAIVKTIQTDTNSAVAAMEKSTEGVVEGARLSDAAGKALTEIETVSNSLARLIQSISSATEAQTEVAATVTKNMQQIQEITSQTTEGTKMTAESVGQLTKLSEELRDSVAGFKLA